ncbi:MAG: hypothetical protein GY827_08630 [Cytophagales bacterium]|nr:hypothetical protein [Cytophagales bacterium]
MKQNHWLILVGVVILHFLLKFFFPDNIGLWNNEIVNVLNVQKDWGTVLEHTDLKLLQPFYLIILSLWTKIVGFEDSSLRLLSVLLSAFTAGSLYFLTVRHFKPNVVIYTSLLFLMSGLDLHYSHEVQYYTLSSLLSVWSFYFFFEIWKNKQWTGAIGLLIVNTLLLYTHTLTWFLLLIQLIVVIALLKDSKEILVKVLLGVFGAFLLYVPWLLKLFGQERQTVPQNPSWEDLINGLIDMAMGLDLLIVYALIFLVVGAGTLFYHVTNKQNDVEQKVKTLSTILWFFLPIIGSFVWALVFQTPYIFQDVVYVTIGSVVLLGVLLESLPIPPMYKMIPFGVLVLVMLTRLEIKNYRHQDVKSILFQVKKTIKGEGAVFLQTTDLEIVFTYYYMPSLLDDREALRANLRKEHVYVGNDASWMKYQELKDYSKIMLIQSFEEYVDPYGTLVKKFSEVFKRTGFDNNHLGIRVYEFTPIQLESYSVEEIVSSLPKIQEEEKILGTIKEIEKKSAWLQRVVLKAKQKNLSVEIMKCLDAIYVLKDEYPQFKKYDEEKLLKQISKIKASEKWVNSVKNKAIEKEIHEDVMLVLDAMYTIQEADVLKQQELEEIFLGKYQYIQGDNNWFESVKKKAQEKNISPNMMIALEAIYVLNQEDSLFKSFGVDSVWAKVQGIQTNQEWKSKVEQKAKSRGISIESMLFLDALYGMRQKRNK